MISFQFSWTISVYINMLLYKNDSFDNQFSNFCYNKPYRALNSTFINIKIIDYFYNEEENTKQ